MLLDRIHIDSHGPLARIGLGPFSQQLNVVFAAAGSGKTALVRFLRDSLTGTTPAYDGMALSSGRVVWAAADGLYHCRREPDGTTEGRRFVEFESRRGPDAQRWNRPSVIVDLPASIVDGIVTDTTLTSVRRVVQCVIRSGLDRGINAAAACQDHGHQAEIAALRAELARLRTLLHSDGDTAGAPSKESQTRDRLAALTLELGAIDSRREFARQTQAALESSRRDREAMSRAVQEVDQLRIQETDLRKRISSLDQALAKLEEQARRDENRIAITQLTRTRVHWLNQQIERLRRVLGEVRELGDHWFGGHLAAQLHQSHKPVADLLSNSLAGDQTAALSRGELEIADRGWLSGRGVGAATGSAASVSGAEIQGRLDSICRLLDHLTGRLEVEQEHWTNLDHPAGELSAAALSESERALQRIRRAACAGDRDGSSSQQRLLADPGWIDDSVRRRRIDSLRRAAQRCRLDETADREIVQGRSEDAFLITLRAIGTSLHSVSRRLRVLRAQRFLGMAEAHVRPEPSAYGSRENAFSSGQSWTEDAWLRADAMDDLPSAPLPLSERAAALCRCERELVATLGRLAQHRVGLLRRVAQAQQLPESLLEAVVADTAVLPAAVDQWLSANLSASSTPIGSPLADSAGELSGCEGAESAQRPLENQHRELTAELQRTIGRMNQKLAEAEDLRTRLRTQPMPSEDDDDQSQRNRIEAEMHRLHRLLAAPANPSLHRFRQCVLRLRALEADQRTASPLAASASSYLERLSGGRLRNVAWHDFIDPPTGRHAVTVSIDSQPEIRSSEPDRYLVALAVRMAAADELSRRGRCLPLVIETPAGIDTSAGCFTPLDDTLSWLTDQHAQRDAAAIQHLVATLGEASERGRQIVLLTEDRKLVDAIAGVGGRSYSLGQATLSAPLPIGAINRNFDIQWRETQGIEDFPTDYAAASLAAGAADHSQRSVFDLPASEAAAAHRSGAHATSGRAADALEPRSSHSHGAAVTADFTIPQHRQRDVVAFPTRDRTLRNGRGGAEESPFFLTGDSPIEQSPSIDVLAAVRLRGLEIVYVRQLLMASPQELAERTQMADVNAATIRRWQSECRLVCGVPGLRGFDARVLVGCGMVHPREIAEIHPAELVEKVEAFLATHKGVQILRTGTSHEVSRLTGWIAEARRSARGGESIARSGSAHPARSRTSNPPPSSFAQPGHAQSSSARGGRKGGSRTRIRRAANHGNGRESGGDVNAASAAPLANVANLHRDAGEKKLKFYLNRQSQIVDAPSIGPRMAERLAELEILTVDDLLRAKPSAVAAALKLRRVDESIVRSWQQQIQLVCRVPMLRGHDAQLLVAAGITDPQRLAQCDPQWLLSQIDPISRSHEGQAILRGGKQPDLAEISQWVKLAKQQRELRAA